MEYTSRNKNVDWGDNDDVDEDNGSDNNDCYTFGTVSGHEYGLDYTLINLVKFCTSLSTCLPDSLGFQLASQDLPKCTCPLARGLDQ